MTTGGGLIRSMRTLYAVMCLSGAAAGGAAGSQADAPPGSGSVLGTGDVVRITVHDQEQLSGLYRVDEDGFFSFPPLGQIAAGGKTLRSVEEFLTASLADGYLRAPRLRATIETLRSRRVLVVGEIENPGVFPLLGDMTFLEAVTLAGPMTALASSEVILVRPTAGDAAGGPATENEAADVIRMDMRGLSRGAERAAGVLLRNGDTVIVPKAPTIFVRGQVQRPGEYPLRRNDTTVTQILALAGGGTSMGALNRIRALRIVDGEPVEIDLEWSDVVRPDDTIVVPRRFF